MPENFAKIGKRCQSTDSRITNTRRVNTEYLTAKLLKTKNSQKILQASRGKKRHFLQRSNPMTSHNFSKTMQQIFNAQRENSCPCRIQYPEKLHFKTKSKIETFSDAEMRKTFTRRSDLREILKFIL